MYVGVGTTLFDSLVAEGRMPKPGQIAGRKVWDVRKLDMALDDIFAQGDLAGGSWDDA
jgi:hypothetical protein